MTPTALPLTTQRSFSFFGIEEIPELTVDQLRFRNNSEKLRERGISRRISSSDMRDLSVHAVIMTFKALAGQEGATPFQRQEAQNAAIAKCMTGDLEGLFENAGINTDAFLDQVSKAFPAYGPHRHETEFTGRLRESLIKFAEVVVFRYKSINVEAEEDRRRKLLEGYDEFF